MGIEAKLTDSIKEAMRAKDSLRLNVLRGIKSALKYKAIDKPSHELTSEDEIAVLRSMMKQRQDSVDQFEKAGATDRANQEKAEMKVLEEFLPQQLSQEELRKLVAESIQEANASSIKDMGAVMKIATQRAAGRVDGKSLSDLVKSQLA